jgi:hypothetical protein
MADVTVTREPTPTKDRAIVHQCPFAKARYPRRPARADMMRG